MSQQERDTQPEWEPKGLRQVEALGSKSSKRVLYTLGTVVAIVVASIGAYAAAVEKVRAETTTVAASEAARAVSGHIKDDDWRFKDINEQLRELNKKIDANQAEMGKKIDLNQTETNRILQQILLQRGQR